MSDWPRCTVEELAAPYKGALATGPFGSSIGTKTFRNSGVPVIRGGNLSAEIGKRLLEDDLVFLDEDLANQFERSAVRLDDLIFTCWGTINQVGFIDKRASYERYIISNKQMKVTVDRDKVYPLFMYYFFSGPVGQQEIEGVSIGSSVPGFNLTNLRKISIPIPPLAVQRRIIEILGALDDKIEMNRRMNETLEAMARAIFKDWFLDFGPTRSKAVGRAPYLAPDLWSLFPDCLDDEGKPEGWRLGTLEDIVDVNPREPLKTGITAPYLEMAALPTSGPIHDQAVPREFTSGMRFRNGDTLLARITPCLENGKTAFVQSLPKDAVGWGSTEFIVLRSKAPVPSAYTYLLARDPAFRASAIQSMTGTSGRQRARHETLASYLVAVPDNSLWRAFGSLIGPMFERIKANGVESETLAQTRDLLLPKLMSGEIRVGEAEALAVAAQ